MIMLQQTVVFSLEQVFWVSAFTNDVNWSIEAQLGKLFTGSSHIYYPEIKSIISLSLSL